MSGNLALDSTTAIRYLNGVTAVVEKVTQTTTITLPVTVVGELLYGAENSARPLQNLTRYLEFINACDIPALDQNTAAIYAKTRHSLKQKGRPIPENDIWIAAQCLQNSWTLVTDDQHFTYVDGLKIEQW